MAGVSWESYNHVEQRMHKVVSLLQRLEQHGALEEHFSDSKELTAAKQEAKQFIDDDEG